MTTFTFDLTADKNLGIAVEHGICAHYGVNRTAHDNGHFDKGSDLCVGNMAMSIKASRFRLMSASLCGGCEDFDGIWNIYEANTHSNCFVYGAKNGTAYMMNIVEFKMFVYEFCTLTRESQHNGGGVKIRCKAESKKMVDWLNKRAVA